MELKILDTEFNLIAVIDYFDSLIWTRQYYCGGTFSLQLPATKETLEVIKTEHIVYKNDEDAGYIETIEISVDESGNEIIKCVGKFLTYYIKRRIIYGKETIVGNIETSLRKLVDKNCITCETSRVIPKLQLGTVKGLTEVIERQVKYENLYDVISELCEVNQVGFKIKLDVRNKKLIFGFYKGLDRTVNQNINTRTIFSKDFENILNETYTESLNGYKNTAYILGKDNKKILVGEANGLNRYETFVDCENTSSEKTETIYNSISGEYEETNVPLPAEEYNKLLKEEGLKKLNDCKEIKTFDANINLVSNSFIYKQDFDLGDLVTVKASNIGVVVNTRITEIEEVYEVGQIKINITFGNSILKLLNKRK